MSIMELNLQRLLLKLDWIFIEPMKLISSIFVVGEGILWIVVVLVSIGINVLKLIL